MAKFTMTHEINCNAARFWKLVFDRSFDEKLHREGLLEQSYAIGDLRETDAEIVRKTTSQPKRDLPGPLAKLFGGPVSYTEESRLDRVSQVFKARWIPSSRADKIRQEGTMRVEAIGDGKVRRIVDMEVEAKIFGVGGLYESSTEKSLREEWDLSASFINRWIADGQSP